jgi:hypothetical protein
VNTKSTKRKYTNSLTTIEKKRTKKTNLFQDVVPVTSLNLKDNPPPPWLDLPIGSLSSHQIINLDFYL